MQYIFGTDTPAGSPGPRAGLDLLAALEADRRLAGHHRLHATKAHLLEMAGDCSGAVARYRKAARRTTSIPERRYLLARAARWPESSPPQMPGNKFAADVENRWGAPT